MFRFTIRDMLWLTVVVALAVGWFLDHRRAQQTTRTQSERLAELEEQVRPENIENFARMLIHAREFNRERELREKESRVRFRLKLPIDMDAPVSEKDRNAQLEHASRFRPPHDPPLQAPPLLILLAVLPPLLGVGWVKYAVWKAERERRAAIEREQERYRQAINAAQVMWWRNSPVTVAEVPQPKAPAKAGE